jgi:hypothetical protein
MNKNSFCLKCKTKVDSKNCYCVNCFEKNSSKKDKTKTVNQPFKIEINKSKHIVEL